MAITVAIGILIAVVAAVILFSVIFYLRPLATLAWFRRNALRRAGLSKRSIAATIGKQIVWHGGAGPLLVLLHGAGDQAGTWNKVVSELQRHFLLLIPDLAGHGESQPPSGALSIGTLLLALEQVLDAEPWRDSPVILAGNSLGAWMAMLYAHKHPQRVARAILIDGGPVRGVGELGLMPKDREEARRTMDLVVDPSSPRPANFVLDDLVRVSNRGPISRLIAAGEQDMSKYLLDGELAHFSFPVDLIWGASDRLVPLEYAKKLQAQLPKCTLSVIERCGHAPQLERPHEFTRVLLRILASTGASSPVTQASVPAPSRNHS
ncbi:MAG TPA: alpha/beta fold hydrolase [Candidatus Sulfotelmatobacter sp.]|nr:alpha/beta fold hydrolase [Candidatus Sulfotelmatobacter sp.]